MRFLFVSSPLHKKTKKERTETSDKRKVGLKKRTNFYTVCLLSNRPKNWRRKTQKCFFFQVDSRHGEERGGERENDRGLIWIQQQSPKLFKCLFFPFLVYTIHDRHWRTLCSWVSMRVRPKEKKLRNNSLLPFLLLLLFRFTANKMSDYCERVNQRGRRAHGWWARACRVCVWATSERDGLRATVIREYAPSDDNLSAEKKEKEKECRRRHSNSCRGDRLQWRRRQQTKEEEEEDINWHNNNNNNNNNTTDHPHASLRTSHSRQHSHTQTHAPYYFWYLKGWEKEKETCTKRERTNWIRIMGRAGPGINKGLARYEGEEAEEESK